MTLCDDEGRLRAYLDRALDDAQSGALQQHLAICAPCRAQLETLRIQATRVTNLLQLPLSSPDPAAALARLQISSDGAIGSPPQSTWRYPMHTTLFQSPRRTLYAACAALVLLFSLLALPPVRAAAEQLLQVFRVQHVMFVSVSPQRLDELKKLNLKGSALFVSKPELTSKSAPPHVVASAADASTEAGFAVRQIATLPSTPASTEIRITGHSAYRFQVNVQTLRQVLAATNVTDV